MPLSLEAIHQPLNDFFLSQFGVNTNEVQFRFDKFGSVLSDHDFLDPVDPTRGYLPALATERFSALVNRVPIDAGDGVNIVITPEAIDGVYLEIIEDAAPYLPTGADDATKEAITNSLNNAMADALKKWDELTLESYTGVTLPYKPSLAAPERWYDKTITDAWTTQRFEVIGPSPAETPPSGGALWRLKPNDEQITRILDLPSAANLPAATGEQVSLTARLLALSSAALPPALRVLVPPVAEPIHLASPAKQFSTMEVEKTVADNQTSAPPSTTDASMRFDLLDAVHLESQDLDVAQRVAVNQAIGAMAPTEPAQTNEITIAFDYCLVHIERPWYLDRLVTQPIWMMPGHVKGDLTAEGQVGALSMMPIAFVAIRNLEIKANWTPADLTSASLATDFGPFKVDPGVVAGTLSHVGLQIVGWLLEKMPELPPNDGPQ